MDIETLRTFLEVARTRHFGKAADNLCITQSAVSARIRLLEERVGVPLFDRARNNIQLTVAGTRLVPHAESIVNRWVRVRQQIALAEDSRILLSVSGSPSLWDALLQDWLDRAYRTYEHLALQVDVQGGDQQIRSLLDHNLDLAFTFETPSVAELTVQEVATVRLLMVSTTEDQTAQDAVAERYVLVDWGTSFASAHAEFFPDMPPPVLRASLGRIAHAFLLNHGGSAYLDEATVAADIDNNTLFIVPDAPTIERYAYAVYRHDNDRGVEIRNLLALFKNTVKQPGSLYRPGTGTERG